MVTEAGKVKEEDGGVEVVVVAETDRHATARGLLRTARPRQWLKNLLVLAAPGAAGVLTDPEAAVRALGAMAVFCVAAAGTYFLNDVLDATADRLHPAKRARPVAAGTVSPRVAVVTATFLMGISIVAAFALAGWQLSAVVAIYVALQPLYSLWLKEVAVLDLAVVASGFVLRAIAGAVAIPVPASRWFLIVASFGSLFMVAGKRTSEHRELGQARGDHRTVLEEYSLDYLRYVRSVSSAVAVAAYCLWAFEKADVAQSPIWFQLSIVPFVLALLRYALVLEGRGGAPEDIVLADRPLQWLGAVWVIIFAVGVYLR